MYRAGGGWQEFSSEIFPIFSVDFSEIWWYFLNMQNAGRATSRVENKLLALTPHARTLLAVALGVTEQTVWNWAKGASEPTEDDNWRGSTSACRRRASDALQEGSQFGSSCSG